MLLISPTEPNPIRDLGTISSKPERYGVDVLWFARRLKFGVQRKRFPDDFIASLHDGRLERELGQMQALDGRWLLIEGYGMWTVGDLLLEQPFSKQALFGLIASFATEFGVTAIRVKDITETATAVRSLEAWTKKDEHRSLVQRPGPKKDKWGQRTSKAWGLHLLQSFPGIGPKQAERIWEKYKGVPLRWEVSGPKELMEIEGIGKVKAQQLWEALQ
jgi:ERCC4-type nuclease